MSFEWVSVYECAGCGTTGCDTNVRYDWLGYAVCDRCSARGGRRSVCR